MRFVPNALSLSRIPLSVALFIFALNEQWSWAAICMIVALITDGLDGAIARRYKVESEFGGKILETYCDLALLLAAVGGLVAGDYWPPWVLVAALVVQVLLDMSHKTSFTRLKRHTFYLHPLFFVAAVIVACYALLTAAYGESNWFFAIGMFYSAVWVAVASRKRDRWMVWLRGPQPASQSL